MTKKKETQSEEFASEFGQHSPASEQDQVVKGLKRCFNEMTKQKNKKNRQKKPRKTMKMNEIVGMIAVTPPQARKKVLK